MKHIILTAVVASFAAAALPGIASAKDATTATTLSARHYYHHWNRGYHRGWRSHYAAAGCRVVVRSHINRWGERIVVRRRVC